MDKSKLDKFVCSKCKFELYYTYCSDGSPHDWVNVVNAHVVNVQKESADFEENVQKAQELINKLAKVTKETVTYLELYTKYKKIESINTKLKQIVSHIVQEMSRGTVDQNELMVYIKNEIRNKPEKKIISSECEK